MMACALSSTIAITSFKKYPFLKTSKNTFYPPPIMHAKKVIGLGNISSLSYKVSKKSQFIISSCMKDNSATKAGGFPSRRWFEEKFAGVGIDVVKALVLWICGWFYKKHIFKKNLPFTKGDLVQVKLNGDCICGVVEEIGDEKTCIRGFNNFPDYVPNGDFDTKNVKNLSLFTKAKPCNLECCVGGNLVNFGKAPRVEQVAGTGAGTKTADSEKRIGPEVQLWRVGFSLEIRSRSYDNLDVLIEKMHAEIIKESLVKEHGRVTILVDSYLSEKQAFKILVACFIDAKNSLKKYLKFKGHLQMKLADIITTYEKNLCLVTNVDACNVECCVEKADSKVQVRTGVGTKTFDSKVQVGTALGTKTADSIVQIGTGVGSDIKLWGVSFTLQVSNKSYNKVNSLMKKMHSEIIKESRVKEHDHVTVAVDSYICEKQAFEILVACFVDAKKSLTEYSKIKGHLQMKLADMVANYEKGNFLGI